MPRAIARGRIVPQSLSTDPRVGRLSLKAALLFPLMWINCDDQGRISGDPSEVKYIACPNIDDITKQDIPELLKELQTEKLILVYSTSTTEAVQMLDWWEEQRLQWAYPSRYPPPEGWQDRLRYKLGRDSPIITENWVPRMTGRPKTEDKNAILARDNYTCQGCGSTDREHLIVHHIIPLRRGGGHDPSNLITLCQKCHIRLEPYEESQAGEPGGNQGGEPGGEKMGFPLTPLPQNKQETEKGKGRGKRKLPGVPGSTPSPSLTADISQILEELTRCFKHDWGKVSAPDFEKVTPREPTARESAQLRDLAKNLSAAGGVPLDYIKQAFREAAIHQKCHISYVRAILLDWLNVPRGPPR